ncbi:phosphomannose isomerase type II C-terminal cupin domain [Paenibacillus xerothermodurans]|uniref:Cupin domain-containing protein n=1 Tax=Paenibacillus xerothermodurans TaxID=1977292 RepID=A0A2W1NLY3_PAEXE|nr:phosphomannose isomerase type II C-terminal cupin domain [Paenibacillus xerothermodurans]PZE20465.1 cupin domain-containing protein [Paenibacillus xerothermodurans]
MNASPKIKDVLAGQEHRPKYEHRRWGYYRVLDHTQADTGQEVLTRKICVKAGSSLSYHMHTNRAEYCTIVSGKGEFVLNNEFLFVQEGDLLQIPAGSIHSMRAITDMEWIEVQRGTELGEDDTVRLFVDWDDIEKYCRSAV